MNSPSEQIDIYLDHRRNNIFERNQINKRVAAFIVFDHLLSHCSQDICPQFIPSQVIPYALTDISLDGYVRQMTDPEVYSQPEAHDENLQSQANEKINCVFNCRRKPTLKEDVFKIDTRSILHRDTLKKNFYASARKRKAYWAYLSNPQNGDPRENYYKANQFIKSVHEAAMHRHTTQADVTRIKKILRSNTHIANALDLYRLCLVRKNSQTRLKN